MKLFDFDLGGCAPLFPIIQGGMGVGISLSSLAGHVAGNGGVGIISTAQAGFREKDFDRDPIGANLRALREELQKAREIADGVFQSMKEGFARQGVPLERLKGYAPVLGFNIMVATNRYEDYVVEAVAAGADVIISGAGLPVDLPEYVQKGMEKRGRGGRPTAMVPIVSSEKSTKVILKMWDRKFSCTADAVVIEGPLAGGHLGFSYDSIQELGADIAPSVHFRREDFDREIKKIIAQVGSYEEKYQKKIPVFVAGGIYTREDLDHALCLGAAGVQLGTRFVTTFECDAPQAYKEAYLKAREEDIVITKSPVGMPGRAIRNAFLASLDQGPIPVRSCHLCLAKCDRRTIPYCITDALVAAARGDMDHALLFCGSNAYRARELERVADVMEELVQ